MTNKSKLITLLLMAATYGSQVQAQVSDALKDIWPITDSAKKMSLNGKWNIKVIKGIGDDKTVPAQDNTWTNIDVPGCWEAYGLCKAKYSFPDSLTGYYRTSFTIPDEWKGERIGIRLDGVLRGYDLWINNKYVGTWECGYNTCQFDITPYLQKKGKQELAMRVYSRFRGFEFDCYDDWVPMGIDRDVTLFAYPNTHISDIRVDTKMDGSVNIDATIANARKDNRLEYTLTDATGKIVAEGNRMKVANPHLWTAETPYLYTLTVKLKDKKNDIQTFTQKVGIREISIDGNLLKVNGKPVKLRGVTCHATDPKTVKVISEELTKKDMKLMKEASINFIRTSHYAREPRFYELADSLGFYVVNEASMGSRGEKNLKKADYQYNMKQRVASTMMRDKNHACVIVWSIGNENPLPNTCVKLGEYAKSLDCSRPICYPQKGSYFRSIGFEKFPKVADIYAPHYPTTSQIRDYYTKGDRPIIFTEYCHSLGISFEDHDRQWEIIEQTPCIAGGSVWEWVDQGMPFKNVSKEFSIWRTDGSEEDQKVYTSTDCGFEMNGNQGTDGMLYADRTPLPNYYELQHNYARAFISDVKEGVLNIVNRFDFVNLKDYVTINWAQTNNGDTIARGAFSPNCEPRAKATYQLPIKDVDGFSLLIFDLSDKDGNHFLRQSFIINKPDIAWEGSGSPMDMIQHGALVRAGRKVTMAERITEKGKYQTKYIVPIVNGEAKGELLNIKTDIQTATNAHGGIHIDGTLTNDTADCFISELGLAYLLDSNIDRAQWIGEGPYASYPGRRQANRYGVWALQKDDIYFEGNRMDVEACYLSDKDGNGIVIVADSTMNINFEQTDRGIIVTVNAAVSGQGPKFARSAFKVWAYKSESRKCSFSMYRIKNGKLPEIANKLFSQPAYMVKPFKPFLTQYDTYLLRFDNILAPTTKSEGGK